MRTFLLLLLALLLCPVGNDSLAGGRKGKKKKKKETQKAAAVKVDPNKPNFDLAGWFYDARRATRSTSVGQANGGRLEHAEKMDLTGRSWRFLPAIKERGTQHGSFALVRLLEEAADQVAEDFPGAILEIGNMGRPDGGPITQSKSHQGGRDVDLAFYALDARGRYRPTGRMLRFDANLKAGSYSFDVDRNWRLVKALLQSEDPVVQWLFVSAPIRAALLEHARKIGEPGQIVRLASVVLHQPGDSSAHADHFHLRIFCSDWDRASGCRDYGPDRPHLVRDSELHDERVRLLTRRARRGLTEERLAAMERLGGLSDADLAGLIDPLLCDADPRIVTRALELLRRTRNDRFDETVAAKLACAGSPDALLVLLEKVAHYGHRKVWQAARKVLADHPCELPDMAGDKQAKNLQRLCAKAARALAYTRDLDDGARLVPLLESKDRQVRKQALHALRTLFVTREPLLPGSTDKAVKGSAKAAWKALADATRGDKWEPYAAAQLQRQGYDVRERLTHRANVPELLRAARAGNPVSFAAQIALARILGIELERPMKARAAHARFKALAEREGNPTEPAQKDPPEKASDKELPPLPVLD
jgi:murein endopeptidase